MSTKSNEELINEALEFKGLIPFGKRLEGLVLLGEAKGIIVKFEDYNTSEDGAFTDIHLYEKMTQERIPVGGLYPMVENFVKVIQEYKKS